MDGLWLSRRNIWPALVGFLVGLALLSGCGGSGSSSESAVLPATRQQPDVTLDEDTPDAFRTGGSTVRISGLGHDSRAVSLTVQNGSLSAMTSSSLTVTGQGTAAAPLLMTGSVAAINLALESLVYTPKPDWNGTDQLTVRVTEPQQGATTTTTSSVTVNAVADSRPDDSLTPQDTPLLNQDVLFNDSFSFTPRERLIVWTIESGIGGAKFIDYGSVTLDTNGTVLGYTGGVPVYDSAGTYAGQIVSVSRVAQGQSELLNYFPAPGYRNADVNGVALKDQAGQDIALQVRCTIAPDYGNGLMTGGGETSIWRITVRN